MIVNDFKASTLTIGWKAQEMSEMLLVRITGKRVYRDLEFEEAQREHRMTVQQKLVNLHQDVVDIMTNSYEVFKNDGPEVGIPCPALRQGAHIPSDHAAATLPYFTSVRVSDILPGPKCSSPSRFQVFSGGIQDLDLASVSLKIYLYVFECFACMCVHHMGTCCTRRPERA